MLEKEREERQLELEKEKLSCLKKVDEAKLQEREKWEEYIENLQQKADGDNGEDEDKQREADHDEVSNQSEKEGQNQQEWRTNSRTQLGSLKYQFNHLKTN